MRTTPYTYHGKQEEISYQRSSKVKYFSERINCWAKETSRRMELATAFNIYTPRYRYTSENYQVMNYGIGGFISLHEDEWGIPDPYALSPGGGRIITAMVYLSDNIAGGRTIFPKVQVGVDPKAGSLLYWFDKNSRSDTDSRMLHLGCPVLYGNKWIANKWI